MTERISISHAPEARDSQRRGDCVATFEQGLDVAFEVAWKRSLDVDKVHEAKSGSDKVEDKILIEGVVQTFIGAVEVLGSLLLLAGRVDTFGLTGSLDEEGNPGMATGGWIEGSSDVLSAMMTWARDHGHLEEAQYLAWKSLYGTGTRSLA